VLDQLEADTAQAPTLREISERFMAEPPDPLGDLPGGGHSPAVCGGLQQTEAVCRVDAAYSARLDAKEISTRTDGSPSTGRTSTATSVRLRLSMPLERETARLSDKHTSRNDINLNGRRLQCGFALKITNRTARRTVYTYLWHVPAGAPVSQWQPGETP